MQIREIASIHQRRIQRKNTSADYTILNHHRKIGKENSHCRVFIKIFTYVTHVSRERERATISVVSSDMARQAMTCYVNLI